MNPNIQSALARFEALKNALGNAAGNAGQFIGNEVKGTIANMHPDYNAIDQAARDRNNQLSRDAGYRGGVPQEIASGNLPSGGNDLGNFIKSLAGVYRNIKSRIIK